MTRSAPASGAADGGDAAARGQRLALVALFTGAAAIGFAPLFVRLSEVGPSATAFHRLLLALPALWLVHGWERRKQGGGEGPPPMPWAGFVVAGLFFAGDLAVWHWSLRFTTVASATLLPNFAPVFVTLAGFVLYGERVSRRFLLGMGLALIGAMVLMGRSFTLSLTQLAGDALGLATALFYAGYIVAVSRLRQHFSTAAIMARSGVVTCVALLPVALASGESLIAPSPAGWAVLLALALVSHAMGQSLIAYALAHLPAPFSSVGLLLQPAVAAGIAWAILAEPLGLWQAVSGAVILAGIVLARQGSRNGTPPAPTSPAEK